MDKQKQTARELIKELTARELIKDLKEKGRLKLYYASRKGIGSRTLYWVNNEDIEVFYNEETITNGQGSKLRIGMIEKFVEDDEAYTNYWFAYAKHLRLTKKEVTTI